MHELHAVLDAWHQACGAGSAAVLATVVHVKGSAYRRPGARMLLLSDGTRIGSVSGGCLEGDLARKAWWLTESGRPTVRTYDTSSDEDAVWEFGLGCNGVIRVLLERLEPGPAADCLEFLESCRAKRREAVVATVLRAESGIPYQVGDRLLYDADGAQGGALPCTELGRELLVEVAAVLDARTSQHVELCGCELFLEWVGPPLSLVIFGAGHDAIPMVAIARELGWEVTVADGRPAYARAERFPGAERVLVMQHEDPLAGIDVGPDTAVVLMTHNYPQDSRLLPGLLERRPCYLGLLGPKVRAERLIEELGAHSDVTHVHAPVGLDIGADTPASIALSIAAEIQAVLAGRGGGMLRDRKGPIHPRSEALAPRRAGVPRARCAA